MKMTKEQFHTIAPKRTDRKFTDHYITKVDNNIFAVEDKVNIIIYIILFIPAVIIEFFAIIWDGGLKLFKIPPRTMRIDYIAKDNYPELYEQLSTMYKG